jgi:hypothetical protein
MKTLSLVVLLLISIITATTGVVSNNQPGSNQPVTNVSLQIKDLPEHGLSLVGPSDASFDALARALMQGRAGASVEALKPFSVFVKNTGKRAVIAYSVKWELTKADGRVATKSMNYVTPWAFAGLEKSARQGHIIAPNSAHFVSLVIDSGTGSQSVNFDDVSNATGVSLFKDNDPFRQSQRARAQTAQLDKLNTELARSTAIKVSLDGAFFDDGTFVGPDTSGFFDKVKALRDAKQDLLRQIENSAKEGEAADALLSEMKALASSPKIRLGPNSTPNDYYNYHKRRYAAEFLRMGIATGREAASERALQSLRRDWPELRKL